MLRKSFPRFIIISGSGQKVGKTYMAIALIRVFSGKFPLLALKISPHVHDSLGNTRLIAAAEGFRIYEELGPNHKNSGQFLDAGAHQSYFMESDDGHLAEAFDHFMKECNPQDHPVICESGALSNLIKPGILIFINDSTDILREDKLKTLERADLVLEAKTFDTKELVTKIRYSNNVWRFTAALFSEVNK
jgi:hypothetical protein